MCKLLVAEYSLLYNILLILLIIFTNIHAIHGIKHKKAKNDEQCEASLTGRYVSQNAYHLGEGPFWDDRTQSLFHVDVFYGDVLQLNVSTGRSQRFNVGNYVSIVIPVLNAPNKLVVSKRNYLIEVDWEAKSYRRLTTNDIGVEKFNDGKVDALGRLWINSLVSLDYYTNDASVKDAGALYRLDGFELTKMDGYYTLPNGMAWNGNNTKFYVADTVERVIYVYDYDLDAGAIDNREIFFNFNTYPGINPWEVPDGMAMDSQDNLWITSLFGARIFHVDTDTGHVLRWIDTLVNQTTSVAFGGPHYNQLFVTNGNRDLITYKAKQLQPTIGEVLGFTAEFICGRPAYKVRLPYYNQGGHNNVDEHDDNDDYDKHYSYDLRYPDKCHDNLEGRHVSHTAYHLGEGSFWDDLTQTLFHVDMFYGDVIQLNVSTGESQILNVGNFASIVIPVLYAPNKLVVSRRNHLIEVDWEFKSYRRLTSNDIGVEKFNDGKVDALGRLWIGSLVSLDYYTDDVPVPDAGALYRLDGDRLTKMDDHFWLPNGQILCSIDTLDNATTSVAFGGPDYTELFVTNGNRYLNSYFDKQLQPTVGEVLAFKAPDIRGRPANRVRLPYYDQDQLESEHVEFNKRKHG
ncbi:unnamed protein product [Oppiella nova]|uniref:SMP-30/Gluconolactonase/LRE-like region domain-containing protein n=1 Tax=Oppiella nova TaxID=334625 RepID=A0A7R9M5Y1_9ACAR|nr:unnamed protein product [Oppiella nova]CAG2171375.1 unnamed protein product [Oppiella nova]